MSAFRPVARLDTHEVFNQPPPFEHVDLFSSDHALADAVRDAGAAVHADRLAELGRRAGSMAFGIEAGFSAVAWDGSAAGHAAHAAILFLTGQADSGTSCPMTMTYAAVPALRAEPAVGAPWVRQILSGRYDPAVPAI